MMRAFVAVVALASCIVFAGWVYRRVELPVRGGVALWAARACVLATLTILLVNPTVPWGSASSGSPWVLLDASLSMAVGAGGASPWAGASTRAEELASEGWRVVTFGTEVAAVGDVRDREPEQSGTRLAPALARAAESGAREVLVLSDLRLEDEVTVRALLDELGVRVRFERFDSPAPNVGIAALRVPDRLEGARPVMAEIEVFGSDPDGTVQLRVREEDEVVATVDVPTPGEGLRRTVAVELPGSRRSGIARYVAERVGGEDAFADDDRAARYARVGLPSEDGVVLVALQPGWEPRYLLPLLGRVTGLPTSGYLRAGPDRFVRMGPALDRGPPVDSAFVREVASAAALLVVTGFGGEPDAWAEALAGRVNRRLLFLRDPAGAERAGLLTGPSRQGEWYVATELPPSPIAGFLAGVVDERLPPLHGVLPLPDPGGRVAPLMARGDLSGPDSGVLYLDDQGGARVVWVVASGFWRWAARDYARPAYGALWAGVADWLLRDPDRGGNELRPVERVVPRGDPVGWRVPTGGATVRVRSERDSAVVDTTFLSTGVAYTVPLAPGTYRYAVSDAAGDSVGSGRFDVSSVAPDLVPAALDPEDLSVPGGEVGARGSGSRPLRSYAWPYLLVVLLLCAEWIGRRRVGLR